MMDSAVDLTAPRPPALRTPASYDEGMAAALQSRQSWVLFTTIIIAAGILTRVVHTGLPLFDKYLGDALYAVMVYGILRIFWGAGRSALCATAIMLAIESFQLTLIPARMFASGNLLIRVCARLIGVQFSFLDLLAYGVGIGCICLVDSSQG